MSFIGHCRQHLECSQGNDRFARETEAEPPAVRIGSAHRVSKRTGTATKGFGSREVERSGRRAGKRTILRQQGCRGERQQGYGSATRQAVRLQGLSLGPDHDGNAATGDGSGDPRPDGLGRKRLAGESGGGHCGRCDDSSDQMWAQRGRKVRGREWSGATLFVAAEDMGRPDRDESNPQASLPRWKGHVDP